VAVHWQVVGVVKNPFVAFKSLSFFGVVCALSERSEFAHTRKQGGACDRVPFSLVLFLLYPQGIKARKRNERPRGSEILEGSIFIAVLN